MNAVRTAIEDFREVGFDDANDTIIFTPAKRRVTVLAIVGKWAMVREKGRRPHVCDVSDLMPNAALTGGAGSAVPSNGVVGDPYDICDSCGGQLGGEVYDDGTDHDMRICQRCHDANAVLSGNGERKETL